MKLPPNSGKRLAAPAIVGLAFVVAGVAAVWVTRQLLLQSQSEQAAVGGERQSAQDKYARATDEEREVRERLVDYRKLLDRGLFGEERRLDWVDRIAEIKTARKLFELKYSIDPQRPLEPPGAGGAGEVELLASKMSLELALLHEEDLLRFIDDLRRALSAHVLVRSCTIERASNVAADRGVAPRLRARCDIDLVTIRDKRLATS